METITTYYKGANKERRALQTQKDSNIVRIFYCDRNYNILTERHQRKMIEGEDHINVHVNYRETNKWVQTKSTKIPKRDIVRKKQSRLELDQHGVKDVKINKDDKIVIGITQVGSTLTNIGNIEMLPEKDRDLYSGLYDQALPKLDEHANVKQPTIATYGEIANIIKENEIKEKVSKLPDLPPVFEIDCVNNGFIITPSISYKSHMINGPEATSKDEILVFNKEELIAYLSLKLKTSSENKLKT